MRYHDTPPKVDAFFDGLLQCHQPSRGLKSGIDTLLLAAAVEASAGQRIAEVGAGVGVASLALAARVQHIELHAIEKEPSLVELLQQNIQINAALLRRRRASVTAVLHDWLTFSPPCQYHHVFSNPPYQIEGECRLPSRRLRAGATAISRRDLSRWISEMINRTVVGGVVTLIHKPENLGLILAAAETKLGGVSITPIVSRRGQRAKRILVRGEKGSRAPSTIAPEVVVHRADGTYCPAIEAMLRKPVALSQTMGALFAGAKGGDNHDNDGAYS